MEELFNTTSKHKLEWKKDFLEKYDNLSEEKCMALLREDEGTGLMEKVDGIVKKLEDAEKHAKNGLSKVVADHSQAKA